MIRFPDLDPTGFCNSEPEPDRTGFRKNSTGSYMDIQTSLTTAVKCFFGYKPDWIKYLDRSTGLGSDQISQWKFWTGLGFQKSPISSTLLAWWSLNYPLYIALLLDWCVIERFVALGLPPWTSLRTRYRGIFTLQRIEDLLRAIGLWQGSPKPFHPARGDILSIVKKLFTKNLLIWMNVRYPKPITLGKTSGPRTVV